MSLSAGGAIATLTLDRSNYSTGLKSAYQELNTFLDNSQSAGDRLQSLGSSITSVGNTLIKTVTLPLVGVGAAAVATAANFEEGMSKVQAISGATAGDMELLSEKAKELGASTKFSATEASEAFSYMAMAGWKTGDMLDGISGIMDLAAASGENLGVVSDIVTDALTAFGLSASDSGHFADVLAAASNNANTNVTMLGESFKYIAPVAGAMGYSVEDTAVALGLMANSGIKAGQAGTSLRSALSSMLKPSDNVYAAMKKLDISLTNADGSSKSLNEVMLMLRDRFSTLTEAQKAEYAATIFGTEAMSGMLAIINTSESDFNKLTTSINKADGTSKKMAETMQNNLKGQLTILKSSLEGAAIAVGNLLVPAITKGVNKVTEMVSAFNNLDDGTKKNIVNAGLMVAALGPVLSIGGRVVTGVGKMVTAVNAVNSAIGGLGLGGLTSGLSAVAVPLAVVGAGFYIWHEATDVANQSVTKSREEMSLLEKVIADMTGKVTYSKDELEAMGLVYADFNENISKEFQESVKNMTTDIHEFGMSLGQINLDEVISAEEHAQFAERVDTALQSALKAIETKSVEMQDGLKAAFAIDGVIDENETSLLEWWSSRGTKEKEEAQKLRDEIAQIESAAFAEGRALTGEEIAAIEERYAQIKQIELEAQASNSYEIEYAHQEFQNRMSTLDAEGAQALLQQRAQQRDDEQLQIRTNYDTLIALAQENYDTLSTEDKLRADDTIARLQEAKQKELDLSSSYYEQDYQYAIEHNENLKDVINKFTGEILAQKDVKYYQELVRATEHYDGINNVTESGYKQMYNSTTKTWDDVYVKVNATTGQLEGVYDLNTQKVGTMTEKNGKLLRDEVAAWQQTSQGILTNCLISGQATVDTSGTIMDAWGNVIGKLTQVQDENGNTVSSIQDVNGTPIDIGENTQEVIDKLKATQREVDNTDGKNATVNVTDGGSCADVQNKINGIKAKPIYVQAYLTKSGNWQMSYATGTDSAMAGVAQVAEYGPELIVSKAGAMTLATGRQLMSMEGGETVYNARQTQEILSSMSKSNNDSNGNSNELLREVNYNLFKLRESLDKKEFNKVTEQNFGGVVVEGVTDIRDIIEEMTAYTELRTI